MLLLVNRARCALVERAERHLTIMLPSASHYHAPLGILLSCSPRHLTIMPPSASHYHAPFGSCARGRVARLLYELKLSASTSLSRSLVCRVACNWAENPAGGSQGDVLLLVQHERRTGVYGTERHLTALRVTPIEGGRSAEMIVLGPVDTGHLVRAARGVDALNEVDVSAKAGQGEGLGQVKGAVAVGEVVVVVLQVMGGARAVCLSVAEGRSAAPGISGAAVTRETSLEVRTFVLCLSL
jgi:hypothetical protein